MPKGFGNKLVVAISSRALFNLDASHAIYEQQGLKSYAAYQVENEDKPLDPGDAFPLVQKLLGINALLAGEPRVEDPAVSQYSRYGFACIQLYPALSIAYRACCILWWPFPLSLCQCVWLSPVPLNGS